MQKATKPRPYEDRGKRLKARRTELQRRGRLPANLDTLAESIGVSRSAIQQWERGETWVTQKNRPKLLAALGWTEEELDHGIARGSETDMSFHPVTPLELEVLALFRALGAEQADFVYRLRAKVAAAQAIRQTGAGDVTVPDAEVRRRMPVTKKTAPK